MGMEWELTSLGGHEAMAKGRDLIFNIIVMMIEGKHYFGRNTGGDEVEARRIQKATSELFHLGGMYLLSDSLPFLKRADFGGYKNAKKNTA
ncbi:hypothetical protein AAC387_Pa05g0561 [Persea americana]